MVCFGCVMRRSVADSMVDYAAECLACGDDQKIGRLVSDLANRWPEEPALAVAFAITSAAAVIEDMMNDPPSRAAVNQGYRLAALVAADIHAIQAMGHIPAVGHDLLHFWRRVDPYFNRLAQNGVALP